MLDQDTSFADELNQMTADWLYDDISEKLFDDWNMSNLNEGLLYADYRLAEMSGDSDIIAAYHKHWELVPGDEYYIGE